MTSDITATYREITHQPVAWAEALRVVQQAQLPELAAYRQVIFTGCGSTFYLSLAAAALCRELSGVPAIAVPGSELWLNPQSAIGTARLTEEQRPALLVAISRSGTTTETLRAVEQFKNTVQGDVVAITTMSEGLCSLADTALTIHAAQEKSIAQTGSFASMYLAAVSMLARLTDRADLLAQLDELPVIGKRLIQTYESLARQWGEQLNLDRFYFLGSGIRYGLACEVNLKMKEMTLTHSEPFHFLEFRHGPMSMVTSNTALVGLLSSQNNQTERDLLRDMQALGAQTLTLAEEDADVAFSSGLPEEVRGVLYLPVLQLMAYYRSLAKGLNPDRPRNLEAVVRLA